MSFYRKSINQALGKIIDIPEWIKEDILKRNNWLSWRKTIELLLAHGITHSILSAQNKL